jgi:hypothetical protein
VTEQEFEARGEARERAARERSDKLRRSHAAEQLRQYHTSLDYDITVKRLLQPKKPADQA